MTSLRYCIWRNYFKLKYLLPVGMFFWPFLEGLLILANALAILNEDRFLAPRGWSMSEVSGNGRSKSLKGQIVGLIYATQFFRMPLIALNVLIIVVKLMSGWYYEGFSCWAWLISISMWCKSIHTKYFCSYINLSIYVPCYCSSKLILSSKLFLWHVYHQSMFACQSAARVPFSLFLFWINHTFIFLLVCVVLGVVWHSDTA